MGCGLMGKSRKLIKGKSRKEYMKEYNQRPDVKAKRKEYLKHHEEEIKAKRKEYYQLHKEEIKAKQKEYHRLHKEELYARQREWFNKKYKTDKSFREKIKKRNREWCRSTDYYGRKRRGNPEVIKDICLKYGLSKEVANAIAMNGEVLDLKMKERGIL